MKDKRRLLAISDVAKHNLSTLRAYLRGRSLVDARLPAADLAAAVDELRAELERVLRED